MPDDTYVQVAPDSSGKKIRNLSMQVLQSDGTVATVYMQVVSIVDELGNPVSLDNTEVLTGILVELKRIRLGMQKLNDAELSIEDILD
jgi:hypothetical protein